MSIRKRWAFLVGINRYIDYGSLNYCVNDVRVLEKLLKAAGYSVWCLHDCIDEKDSNENLQRFFPTEKNIRGRFADFCSLVKGNYSQDDLLLVYFACHGSAKPDGAPRLIAYDTQRSLEQEAISITDIEQGMENSGVGCRMLMLDACQIGLGTSDMTSRATPGQDLLEKIHGMANGYALLAASRADQDANESDDIKHGVFSAYVLSGLSSEAAALDGKAYTTTAALAGYVDYHMREWAASNYVSQAPCQRMEGNLGGFILIPKEHQQKVAEFNPFLQGDQSRGRSPAQVIDALWSLDCEPQCEAFKAGTLDHGEQQLLWFKRKIRGFSIGW